MRQTPKLSKQQHRPNERKPLDQLIQLIAGRIVRKLKEMQDQDGTKCREENH